MSKAEKWMISAIVILLALWIFWIFALGFYIQKHGGIRGVIVDVGKEVKGIITEIQED